MPTDIAWTAKSAGAAGDTVRTLDCLERAYEVHDPSTPYIAVLPHFDLVRDDPRFRDLCRRMNLPRCAGGGASPGDTARAGT